MKKKNNWKEVPSEGKILGEFIISPNDDYAWKPFKSIFTSSAYDIKSLETRIKILKILNSK